MISPTKGKIRENTDRVREGHGVGVGGRHVFKHVLLQNGRKIHSLCH